jgi:hypothetical protein
MKWSSGMFASGIKVVLVDPGTGAKEMHKLHPSKPANTGEDKGDNKDATAAAPAPTTTPAQPPATPAQP